jgi:hypothetical protein
MNTPRSLLLRALLSASATLCFPAAMAFGQQAAPAATPAQLAKYDANRNGRLDPAELTALQADEARAAATPTTPGAGREDVVELTPFEVKEANNGYYASSTMSGTRLNAKLEDLASSISVVTKQQMADFALLDINDIFNYEVSTEGTGNFTSFTVDRNGMVGDSPMDNPQEANRIRGLTNANISLNNFAMSGRVPIDPINIDAVEISRGPNSNIFGLGQGSGTVNLVAATANFNRSTSTAELRFDDIGGYRASLDVNRPIIRGKLGLRASAVYQHEEFRQKPSGTTSRRYNAMLRAQPFKNTTIRASYQHYEMYGTRATTVTPRDTVSYWKSLGSPMWDPVPTTDAAGVQTFTVTFANGTRTTVTGTTNPTGLGSPTFANPAMFIDQGGIQLWQITRMPGATATNGPNNTTGVPRLLETVAPPVRGAARPLFSTVPGISDRAIFDYSSINLAGPNKILDTNDTTTVELEQYFLNSDRQKLALQLGWNREDAERVNWNMVGRSSATGNSSYLYVDVNTRLLDGRANPFAGRPYLGIGEPVHDSRPYLRDTYRGQGAYILDLAQEKNALRWLGRNQVVGYMEQRLTKSYSYRFRDVNIRDNPIYAPAGQPKANQSGTAAPLATRIYNRFYVGDNQGQNIDYAPSPIRYGEYPFSWFNPLTNQWVTDTGLLAESAIQEGSAGTFASQNMIKTHGFVFQHTLLQDRVVLTWGTRHDENYNKFQRGAVLKANGYEYDYAAMDGWLPDNNLSDGDGHWAKRTGDTKTKGAVVRPFRFTAVSEMAKRGGAEGFFGQLLHGLGVYYNQSDSFRPETPAITVLQTPLPNPTSLGKDYGFTLNLWDNKVVVRANRYVTDQINSRNGEFRTFGDRIMRVDFAGFAGNNDAISLQRQARNWVLAANPAFTTAQVDAQVYSIMKLTNQDETTIRNGPLGETQDATAKGDEVEIFLNPDRFWTIKANVTRTRSIDANVAPNIPEWVAQRLPTWETIIDPRTGVKWLDQGYNGDNPQAGSGTPRAFLQNNIVAPINLARAIQGKNRSQVREWRYNASASLRLAKYSEHRWLKNVTVGGSMRWEDKAVIGYYGIPVNGDIAAATNYDPDRPIYDKAHAYFDAFAYYNTRLFKDKVRARFQLNVRNIQESRAHLQPVGAFPDGTPHTFRVIDPRVWIFSTTFDL